MEQLADAASDAEMADPSTPGLTVSAVARLLGVAPSTLRTWDRRYGLGPTGHTEGRHRRYAGEDVERLTRMQELVRNGVATADAARAAQSAAIDPQNAVFPTRPQQSTSTAEAAAEGLVHSTDPAAHLVRGLGKAVAALDEPACVRLIRGSIAARGVVWTWDQVLRPVLIARGRIWARTGRGIEVEHFLANVTAAEFTARAQVPEPVNARPVLLACAPEEQHCLPLHAVAAALAERGIASLMLGERTPFEAVASAVRRVGPSAVMVWARIPGADPDGLAGIGNQRPPTQVWTAGPGWVGCAPAGVRHVDDLAEAVAGLSAAAR